MLGLTLEYPSHQSPSPNYGDSPAPDTSPKHQSYFPKTWEPPIPMERGRGEEVGVSVGTSNESLRKSLRSLSAGLGRR